MVETKQPLQDEVRRNFEVFQKLLPDLLETDRGKFALMRHTKIIQTFDTVRDAVVYGQKEFDDGLFSVQEISDRVVDLGFYSYALHYGSV